MNKKLPTALSSLIATCTFAGDLTVSIDIPQLEVAEYHRPYLAVWIENPDHSVAANLAVWYDVEMKNGKGKEWLKDLRQWWRKSGRSLDMPVDGISGPTRAPGTHELALKASDPALAQLAAGDYQIVVEASREVGGRELLRLPFSWGTDSIKQTISGDSELGEITLTIQ